MKKGLLLLVIFLITLAIQNSTILEEKRMFFPKNSLRIPADAKGNKGITQVEFDQVLDHLDELYRPEIAATGNELIIKRLWRSERVNAFASQSRGKSKVVMFGGLARHALVDKDTFALVACHEFGHLLGGAPKIIGTNGPTWASNEGQADYWATLKCLKILFEVDDNQSLMAKRPVSKVINQKCSAVYTDLEEASICKRILMAGMNMGNLARELMDYTPSVSYETPDPTVVLIMEDEHTNPQCRIDTFMAGATCDIDPHERVDNQDVLIGTCNRIDGRELGVRPLCWYKPEMN